MNCIKKIRIRNFRSIVDLNIDCSELNVFAGNNDAGKSNILKALDLFFNSEVKYAQRFVFNEYYSRFAPERINKAKEITITITFQPPASFDSKAIVWTKKWRKTGSIPYTEDMKYIDRTEINTRSKFPLWLKRLRFEYIPAIKGTEYFSELLQKLHDSLIVTVEDDVRTASSTFIDTINTFTEDLSSQLMQRLYIQSNIQVPSDLQILFTTLDFETSIAGQKISLKNRGDGIKNRYIPVLLKFIEEQYRKNTVRGEIAPRTIWGYEEPENNLEMSRSFELGDDFLDYLADVQIFLTTHSPAFYRLSNKEPEKVALYNVRKAHFEDTNQPAETKILCLAHNSYLDEQMGILPLISPYIEEEVKQRKSLTTELELIKRDLEQDNKPVIFTEGLTDKDILQKAFKLFCPKLLDCVTIKSKKSAGVNWVRDMLLAWTYLRKEYPCLGLFDNDRAGKNSKTEVDQNPSCQTSKEKKLLKTIMLKMPSHFHALSKMGIKLPVFIEDYFPPECWRHAETQGWLEERTGLDKSKTPFNKSYLEYCKDLGLNNNQILYLNQIKNDNKKDFKNYVIALNPQECETAFANFKPLVNEISAFFS